MYDIEPIREAGRVSAKARFDVEHQAAIQAQRAGVGPREFGLTDGLKWARHMRLELAFEIQKLESGIRKVTDETANGPVDVTEKVLAAQKDRFDHLDEMIEAFAVVSRAGIR